MNGWAVAACVALVILLAVALVGALTAPWCDDDRGEGGSDV